MSNSQKTIHPAYLQKPPLGERRKYLAERLSSLNRRVIIIEEELIKLDENRFYRTCIFGSARTKPGEKIYNEVVSLAEKLATEGIDVLTGGGPGLMEAGNIGAKKGREKSKTKSLSYGITIELDFEPEPNMHLDVNLHHLKFSSRLDEFMRLSHSAICTPGGVGTLLELFFTWQLVQKSHIPMRPIVLLESEFWKPLIQWMKDVVWKNKFVSDNDFDYIHIVDTVDEAFEIISKHHKEFREKEKK